MTHYTRSKVDPRAAGGADRRGRRRRDAGRRRGRGQQRAATRTSCGRPRALDRGAATCSARRSRPTSRAYVKGRIAVDAIMVDFEGAHVVGASPGARERVARRRWRDRRARRRRRRASGGERRRCSRTRRWSPAAGATSRRWRRRGRRRRSRSGRRSSRALEALAAHDGRACVLASGDPGFFGIVRALAARVGAERSTCAPRRRRWPSPSRASASPWDDALVVTAPRPRPARRRSPPPCATRRSRSSPHPAAPPAWYAQRLAGSGRALAVAERLGERRRARGARDARGDRARDLRRAERARRPRPGERRHGRARVWPPRTPARLGAARRRLRAPRRDGHQGRGARARARRGSGPAPATWCGTSAAAAARWRSSARASAPRRSAIDDDRRRDRTDARATRPPTACRSHGRRGRRARGAGRAPRSRRRLRRRRRSRPRRDPRRLLRPRRAARSS